MNNCFFLILLLHDELYRNLVIQSMKELLKGKEISFVTSLLFSLPKESYGNLEKKRNTIQGTPLLSCMQSPSQNLIILELTPQRPPNPTSTSSMILSTQKQSSNPHTEGKPTGAANILTTKADLSLVMTAVIVRNSSLRLVQNLLPNPPTGLILPSGTKEHKINSSFHERPFKYLKTVRKSRLETLS